MHLRPVLAAIALALLPLGGCASWSNLGAPLQRAEPQRGYRLADAVRPHDGDQMLLVASFSGGGMRAAALAHGALRQLAATPLGDGPRTLLDELDVISGVSGGAVAAAYFALDRERYFRDFETRFLRQNVSRGMWWSLLNPFVLARLMSHRFARGDLYAEMLDRRLFRGASFAALEGRETSPFVILNATDLGVGARFEFTQDMFDALCIDLARYPLARAVAASAAAPPAVTPLALRNRAGRCGYRLPDWVARDAGSAAPGDRREMRARELRAWQQADRYPWLQLADGSIVDDLGIRALTDALLALDERGVTDTRRIVLVMVNAAADTGPRLARRRAAPGELETARRAAQVSFERYSAESVLLLQRLLDDLRRRRGEAARDRIYLVEVDPRALADEAERDAVMSAPTTLALPRDLTPRIVAAGARLLQESPEFQRLRQDLQAR